jgi:hypothetical protein
MSEHLTNKARILKLCSFSFSVMLSGCNSLGSLIGRETTERQPTAPPQAIEVAASVSADDRAIPRHDHLFVIIAENKSYNQIVGSPDTPTLNRLAKTYGLATHFYGEVHPSEANYIAILGGSTFGVHDDDAYDCQPKKADSACSHSKEPDYVSHTIASKSLVDQLEEHGLTWKGYFEDIPAPGSKAVVAPSVVRALYASKHNGFISFKRIQSSPDRLSRLVGLPLLTTDLNQGTAPNYSQIVLNQCHEMHGLPECPNHRDLIRTGDAQIGKLVDKITQSPLWATAGNNAIVITWDEDNNPPIKTSVQGCCGFDPKSRANFGGGHIATIVITSHGRRGVVDDTPYNHYSLLRTTEDAFGIYEYLNEAGNTQQGVKPMLSLFAK